MSNLDNLLDPNCTTTALNPTLFPVGTAQHMDINYNIFPFLCDLLKATTDNNFNPILADNTTPFDLTPYTDFSTLNAIGDPRVSLGETMTQTYVNFLPRVITQTEVRQNGGTQVIDNYICNADGVPIKKSETIPILLSLDLTGKTSYKYGAITIPPLSATYEQLMEPINPNEVIEFVKKYVDSSKIEHADFFVNFINKYYNGWSASVSVYKTLKYIIVTLTKEDKTVYLKYYEDVANKVACLLGLNELKYILNFETYKNMAYSNASNSKIVDYKTLMEGTESDKYYSTVMPIYTTTPDMEYTTLFAATTSNNTSKVISYLDEMAAMVKQSATTTTVSISTVPVIPC
jgi:hypothetical protein